MIHSFFPLGGIVENSAKAAGLVGSALRELA